MVLTQSERLTDAQVEQLWRLYQHEWWSEERALDDVRRMLAGSDELVAFVDESGNLAAFARVLTDYVYRRCCST